MTSLPVHHDPEWDSRTLPAVPVPFPTALEGRGVIAAALVPARAGEFSQLAVMVVRENDRPPRRKIARSRRRGGRDVHSFFPHHRDHQHGRQTNAQYRQDRSQRGSGQQRLIQRSSSGYDRRSLALIAEFGDLITH